MFMVVNSVLLNAAFGIILDTFASNRDDDVAFRAQRNNLCAICGLEQGEFRKSGSRYFKTTHVLSEVRVL